MTFDWRYTVYNNLNFFCWVLAASLSAYFISSTIVSFTVMGIAALVVFAVYWFRDRPYRIKHPEYAPNNRKIGYWKWAILAYLICFVLLMLIFWKIGSTSRLYFPALLVVIFLINFLRDGLTQPKSELTQSSGSKEN